MNSKALLVGINDYAPAGVGGPDLNGCVNDVRDMATTLSAIGVVPIIPSRMQILTDKNATRSRIMTGLNWLMTGAKKGDTLVFYYSGHGSYIVDASGDELDRRDEVICPHDFSTAGYIRDDDLRAVFKTLPAGVNLEVILDSCFSGTGTRDLEEFILETGAAVRFIEPPIDDSLFADEVPVCPLLADHRPVADRGDRVLVPTATLNHVLWAAAKDTQLAQEKPIGGIVRGVFTYNFCKFLRAAGTALPLRRALDYLVTGAVSSMAAAQTPQLEGTTATFAEKVFR
ncbi:MAG: caspase family protein [Acidobacteria bacterium]|nr:caspase family protein [Acidobacteriota bacterium]